MKELLIVLLIPVAAQFIVHGWRVACVDGGQSSVDHWRDSHNEALRRVLEND